MRAPHRSKLDIVVVLPQKPEALKEELAVGATQAEVLAELTSCAKETGHALGVYNVAVTRDDGTDQFVYIHSKLMVVDDRVLTIGSANLNNRSMCLDSEVNVSWTARSSGDEVAVAIAALRKRLLREHVGLELAPECFDAEGLVDRLDALATSRTGRLRMQAREGAEPSFLMKLGQRIASAYADPLHSPESRESPLLFDGPAPDRAP